MPCNCPIPDHVVRDIKVHKDTCTATRSWKALCCGAEWTDEPTLLEMVREADTEGQFEALDPVAVATEAAGLTEKVTQDEESRLRMAS